MAWAEEQEVKVGLISRGYKGRFSGEQRVRLDSDSYFGDEPSMLAQKHPQSPVYVGKDRVAAAGELLRNHQVELLFADDAFQHRRLDRDLDVVVVDVLEPIEHYRPLPFGRARESIEGLSRADVVVFNKVNLLDDARDLSLRREFLYPYLNKATVVEGSYVIPHLYHAKTGETVLDWEGESLALVSGLGRPQAFEKSLQATCGFHCFGHMSFPDHHDFTASDVQGVLARSRGSDRIVCTEKDLVKLKAFEDLYDQLWVAPLKLKFNEAINEVYRKISSLVCP
jgi:tetraacyldisaccharide 4'-kinase